MPLWLKVTFQVLFFVVIFLVVYKQLKIHVLSKFHPNKWIIFGLSVGAFFIPTGIVTYLNYDINGTIWQYLQSAVFIVLFLWFIDLRNGAIYDTSNKRAIKKRNDVIIKPKAKPNRVNKNGNK